MSEMCENKIDTLLNNIKNLHESFYTKTDGVIAFDTFIDNICNVKNTLFLLYDEQFLNDIITIANEKKLTFELMNCIINSLDIDLWIKFSNASFNHENVFVKNIGIYLLKLNPYDIYYRAPHAHFTIPNLDSPLINHLKNDFLQFYGTKFKTILKNEIRCYHDPANNKLISTNIGSIFN